ncbi:MAG TPA: hypothetical protein VLE23_16930 [Geminicoccaceae bacterium]|nr:hypothetical protein [Geminicoccaceae bacterium]
MSSIPAATEFGPWNPGIRSQLPADLLPLATIFRPENVLTSLEEAYERSAFTGLDPEDHVIFRPERLAVHEVLIRVTGDISVPDGPNYEDLGINFREIAGRILTKHVEPHMAEIVAAYDDLRDRVVDVVGVELASTLFLPSAGNRPAARSRKLFGFFGGGGRHVGYDARESLEERDRRVLAEWRRKAESAADPFRESVFRNLVRLASAIHIKHGRLRGDQALLTSLAAGMICNQQGSELIGRTIDPYFRRAAEREGYRLLPTQGRPVVMNVKGASASGKSTMRPLQRKLAEAVDIPWSDFAVISPDIWRKYLLDYASLGEASKYAGTLTGLELKIVDQKLDRYMARKAESHGMSHLLIDRFRFDSFAEHPDEEEGSRLLTRFGNLVYMFFMITPPDATVERAWLRGRQVGRYKAVDDLLDHNIEAYTGMPRLFFTWALRADKAVHYEFLDNSVPEGQRPRTVAFGWNDEMNILDIKCLLDVDRYKKINVHAKSPEDVYADERIMAPGNNVEFLQECARSIRTINFVERESGVVYARMEEGKICWADPAALANAIEDAETRAGLAALSPGGMSPAVAGSAAQRRLEPDQAQTVGQWAATPITY